MLISIWICGLLGVWADLPLHMLPGFLFTREALRLSSGGFLISSEGTKTFLPSIFWPPVTLRVIYIWRAFACEMQCSWWFVWQMLLRPLQDYSLLTLQDYYFWISFFRSSTFHWHWYKHRGWFSEFSMVASSNLISTSWTIWNLAWSVSTYFAFLIVWRVGMVSLYQFLAKCLDILSNHLITSK